MVIYDQIVATGKVPEKSEKKRLTNGDKGGNINKLSLESARVQRNLDNFIV